MNKIPNMKFHSTQQFRNVVKHMKNKGKFKGLDEEGNAIIDESGIAPTVDYIGTVKLHGTNASIVLHEDETISFHSKNNILGSMSKDEDGEYDLHLNSDNAEFAQTMYRRKEAVLGLKLCVLLRLKVSNITPVYPIKISGEWCGQGIQHKVGISFLHKKSFFVFGVKNGEDWLPMDVIKTIDWTAQHVYNIMDFPTRKVTIDFNQPEMIQNELVKATEEVEECCPVSKQLGVEESLLGEGLVWVPSAPEYCKDSGNFFKTKGKKHSVSKTKSVAAVDPEKIRSIKEFVEYAVTENRLEQGVGEIGLDQKTIGKFIGWVNQDINKEEGDVLEANHLTMKDVGKFSANKAREYYVSKLNSHAGW
jgi:hypothetical protein